MRVWRLLIQTIGAITILLCAWGFYSLIYTLPRGLALGPDLSSDAPYFRTAFLVMIAIDGILLTLMIVCAVGLLGSRRLAVIAYTGLSICFLIYYYGLGFLWRPGAVGMSIAAASGVGNAALAPLVFYPVKFLYLAVTVVLANLALWRLRKESTNPGFRNAPKGRW